jgi:NAD(P)-dependent dehydrogenase (short-subunit alcohol dehydrogenase family)
MSISTPPGPTTTGVQERPGTAPGPVRQLGRVLVTGAASGLGRAVAAAVAEGGGVPLLLDRVDAREANPDLDVPSAIVDLADARAAEDAVREVCAGGVDAVVTAAGTDACGKLEEVDGATWDRVVAVNLIGTAAVIRAALPGLRASTHGGRIVTVASTLGLRALSDASAYCAAKFGVVGLSRALAVELAGEVGVTMLVPGGMNTAFFDGRTEQYRPGPDAMLNDPRAVADTVVFALTRPPGCEVRELIVTPSVEPSWP